MNKEFLLENDSFRLSLIFNVYESDILYSTNTILSVAVTGAQFSASATMDIDIKDIQDFCNNLKHIYDCFAGTAKIQEPYGDKQYILFSSDKYGHVTVSGYLNSNGVNNFWLELKFENSIDQTHLLTLFDGLNEFLKQIHLASSNQ